MGGASPRVGALRLNEFINPNYHVVLVHFPLALLGVGLAIEVMGALLWRNSSARLAARWMICIGAMMTLPTSAVGMYALADVHEPSAQADLFLERHAWLAGGATILSVFAVTTWIALSDRWRRLLHWPLLLVVAMAGAMSVAGAWFAGEAVYRHGTGVEVAGADVERDESTAQPAGSAVARTAKYFLPPLQAHVLFAGFAASFAFAGLGLAIRRLHTDGDEDLRPAPRRYRSTGPTNDPAAFARLINDDVEVTPAARTIPAARFFAIGLVLAILAGITGWWYLIDASDAWAAAVETAGRRAGILDKVHALLRGAGTMVFEREKNTRLDFVSERRAFHALGAGLIVACLLTMAILARWAKRRAVPLALVSLLLLAAVAFQAWLGGLLMFEGPEGPVTGLVNGD